MPRIAALLGATALLSGVIVWLPIEASATISINDSFANSTTDASVVGAVQWLDRRCRPTVPVPHRAVISQSSATTTTITTADSKNFNDQIATTGNTGSVTFNTTSAPSDINVSATGFVTTTGSLGVGTYTATGTDLDSATPIPDTGTWGYTLVVVASNPPINQSAPTADTTTTTASFPPPFTDQITTTGNTGPVTYTATPPSSSITVDPTTGAVSTTEALGVGTYSVAGTDIDTSGHTGTWSYTLHVTASATTIQNCDALSPDPDGSGSLMLTDANFYEASNVIYNGSFSTLDGLDLTFDAHMFGGQNTEGSIGLADGISFDLAAPGLSAVGQPGGALGYSTTGPGPGGGPGMPDGYLGVGLDEYGNYADGLSQGTYEGSDCIDPTWANFAPNEVTVRGPGNGTAGYCLLSSSRLLPDPMGPSGIQLHGTTWATSQITVHIIIDPTNSTYLVSLQPVGVASPTTVTSGPLPTTYYDSSGNLQSGIPPTLTFAVAASTGGGTDFHEINNLSVNPATLQSIAVTPANPSIAAGDTQQFTATGTYSDGTTEDLTSQVVWGSATTATATITSPGGLATGLVPGTSTITATDGSISGNTLLTVTPATLQSIAVTPANPSIAAGDTQQFTATGTYSDGTTEDLTSQVVWGSATTATATITSPGGLATGLVPGTSTITATDGSISGNTLLTVTPATLQSIAVTPANPSIAAGDTQQFTATGTYSDGTTEDLTSQVVWGSATTADATISSGGLATGV